MFRDKAITTFRDRCNAGNVLEKHQWPSQLQVVSQRTKHRLSAATNSPVGFDKLHRLFKLFTRQLRKPCGNLRILEGKVINAFSDDLLPAIDPEAAKLAVAVEDHQRFCWRRGHLCGRNHGTVLIEFRPLANQKGEPTPTRAKFGDQS